MVAQPEQMKQAQTFPYGQGIPQQPVNLNFEEL
jgi:hypothetical protein